MPLSLRPLLVLLALGAACAPAAPSPADPAPRPLPDVTLEQCGPAPTSGILYLEGQVTRRPNITKLGRITYPSALRAQNIRGEVLFAFVIDPDGKVVEGSIRTLAASDPGFVDAARRLVVSSQYLPALLEGHAVAVCTAQKIYFTP